jgi:hypothetical protein
MRWRTSFLIVSLVGLVGCGGGRERELQQHVDALTQQMSVADAQITSLAERIDSCRSSIRQLDEKFKEASFHIDQLPELVREMDGIKTNLEGAADVLKVVSRKGDFLVARGLVVADDAGNPRCLVSPLGLVISDKQGQRVCEIQYDDKQNAMTASLRGRNRNSVALYAGEDRAAIGAYDVQGDGLVGWAASVTPGGQVTAGRAGR